MKIDKNWVLLKIEDDLIIEKEVVDFLLRDDVVPISHQVNTNKIQDVIRIWGSRQKNLDFKDASLNSLMSELGKMNTQSEISAIGYSNKQKLCLLFFDKETERFLGVVMGDKRNNEANKGVFEV